MSIGSEPTGVVFNIMRFAVHDGAGIRTTVFFKGCPLECWWCHNPESQPYLPSPVYFEERCRHCGDCIQICPEDAIGDGDGRVRTDLSRCLRCGTCVEQCAAGARELCGWRAGVDELMAQIERDIVFFDESSGGITLSGGEPMTQPRFAVALLGACRVRRIHTTVETCGFVHPLVFQTVAKEASLVLFDLKTLDRDRHRRYTGVFNDTILSNLEWLAATGRPFAVRIAVVPGVNDSAEDARQFASYLSLAGARQVHLLPYHRHGSEKYKRLGQPFRLEELPQPAPDEMERFAQPLRQAGLNVTIGV